MAKKRESIIENLRSFIAECEANAIPDDQIDFTDIPEVTDKEAMISIMVTDVLTL